MSLNCSSDNLGARKSGYEPKWVCSRH